MELSKIENSMRMAIGSLFCDVASLFRSVHVLLSDSTSIVEYQPLQIDIPCRLSRVMSRKTDIHTEIPHDVFEIHCKLYVDPSCDIASGDRVKLSRFGEENVFSVGHIFTYVTHKECMLEQVVEI